MTAPDKASPLYTPELDGLRFFAFLAVFFHHLARGHASLAAFLQSRGWIGVDIFFVISSILFFRLFDREWQISGRIDIGRFWLRRILRLYPLMVAYPALVLLAVRHFTPAKVLQLLDIAAFGENIAVWIRQYNTPIPFTAHLWTLSFEFQIYLLIPFAFLLCSRVTKARFAGILFFAWGACACARALALNHGVGATSIWVTPIFHPDTVLIGMLVSLGLVQVRSMVLLAGAVIGAALVMALPNIDFASGLLNLTYPAVALFSGSVVLLIQRAPLRSLMSNPALVFLGRISFGLYVFHVAGIAAATRIMAFLGYATAAMSAAPFAAYGTIALALTLAAASVSYYTLERYFLRLKSRVEVVHGRPAT